MELTSGANSSSMLAIKPWRIEPTIGESALTTSADFVSPHVQKKLSCCLIWASFFNYNAYRSVMANDTIG